MCIFSYTVLTLRNCGTDGFPNFSNVLVSGRTRFIMVA